MGSTFDMYDIKAYKEIPEEVMEFGQDLNYENELGKVVAKVYDDVLYIIDMEVV